MGLWGVVIWLLIQTTPQNEVYFCIRENEIQRKLIWRTPTVVEHYLKLTSSYITRFVLQECEVTDDAIRILAVVIMCKWCIS